MTPTTTAPLRERILTAIRTAGHGLTVAELAEATNSVKSAIYPITSTFAAAGVLHKREELRQEQHGTVYYIRPVQVWALAEEE